MIVFSSFKTGIITEIIASFIRDFANNKGNLEDSLFLIAIAEKELIRTLFFCQILL
jgi:hypothetical protein